MLISWNGETMPDLPLEQELEIAAAAGYNGVELFIPKLATYLRHHTAQDLAQRLHQHQLIPFSLNGIENINFRTPADFAQIKEECNWLAKVGQAIACATIVVVPSPSPAELTWREIKAETVTKLSELAEVAAIYGVKLGFEFLAPLNCSVRTLAQGLEIVKAAGRENIGLVLDTYHFYVGGSSWMSLEELEINQLLLVHLNDVEDLPLAQLTDGDRLLPGEGILPLPKILSRLLGRGYQGPYSLEVMRPAYREREPLEYARAGLKTIYQVLQEAKQWIEMS